MGFWVAITDIEGLAYILWMENTLSRYVTPKEENLN